jgi:hypothetical protein
VEKSKRFPRSPETGSQEEYVRKYRRIRGRGLSIRPVLGSARQDELTMIS